VILAHLSHFASHAVNSLAMFQDEQAVGFSPMDLWGHMGWPVRFAYGQQPGISSGRPAVGKFQPHGTVGTHGMDGPLGGYHPVH
jgi:hypothetical protein